MHNTPLMDIMIKNQLLLKMDLNLTQINLFNQLIKDYLMIKKTSIKITKTTFTNQMKSFCMKLIKQRNKESFKDKTDNKKKWNNKLKRSLQVVSSGN